MIIVIIFLWFIIVILWWSLIFKCFIIIFMMMQYFVIIIIFKMIKYYLMNCFSDILYIFDNYYDPILINLTAVYFLQYDSWHDEQDRSVRHNPYIFSSDDFLLYSLLICQHDCFSFLHIDPQVYYHPIRYCLYIFHIFFVWFYLVDRLLRFRYYLKIIS